MTQSLHDSRNDAVMHDGHAGVVDATLRIAVDASDDERISTETDTISQSLQAKADAVRDRTGDDVQRSVVEETDVANTTNNNADCRTEGHVTGQVGEGSCTAHSGTGHDVALAEAERDLQAARDALAAAEKKLAEVQGVRGSYTQAVPGTFQQSSQGGLGRGLHALFDQTPEVTYQKPVTTTSDQQQVAASHQAPDQYYVEVQQQASYQEAPNQQYVAYQEVSDQSVAAQQTSRQGYVAAQGIPYQQYNQQHYSTAQQQTPRQSTVQPHYGSPIASRDHVAAGLLAIFLGWLGVHKFYLGYNTQGFIMLAVGLLGGILTLGFALGIVWVVAVIEGIIYLVKSQSEFERIYVFSKKEWF